MDEPTLPTPIVDILVVDDTPANLVAMEAVLRDAHTNLVMASSGAEALKLLLERDFALILLDVQMPDMDGFQTAKLIRSRNRSAHIPIIFVTAYGDDDTQIELAYELGAVDFLFKPVVSQILRAKVHVFVELERRAAEVTRQAKALQEAERRSLEQRLAEARQRWEAEHLRTQMEEQKRAAEEARSRAEQLALTVSEKVRAEKELSRINRRLEEADRRKNEFIAMLAHELRNPLATIVYAVELMKAPEDPDPIFEKARTSMERQLKHLRRLVDDLLDVSRVTSGKIELKKEPRDLQTLAAQAVETSRSEIDGRHHELEVEISTESMVVMADPVRITQVVSNLLNNAARYTDEGGHIRLEVRRDGEEAIVTVSDDGRGIAPEMASEIFEVFVQERSGGGGLGLGLALVKRLVENHGGTVGVQSEGLGQGSTFEVRLPLIQGVAKTTGVMRAVDTTQSALRVVVIDDEDDIRSTLAALLERWGHTVQTAPGGAEGIELVIETRPELVLTDIGMPEVDGYAVMRAVAEKLGDERPRMIATTGYGRGEDRARCAEAGFDSHLVKPVSAEELRRALAGESSFDED